MPLFAINSDNAADNNSAEIVMTSQVAASFCYRAI
jgi:hypothetical protein